jgi:hypothetical protein
MVERIIRAHAAAHSVHAREAFPRRAMTAPTPMRNHVRIRRLRCDSSVSEIATQPSGDAIARLRASRVDAWAHRDGGLLKCRRAIGDAASLRASIRSCSTANRNEARASAGAVCTFRGTSPAHASPRRNVIAQRERSGPASCNRACRDEADAIHRSIGCRICLGRIAACARSAQMFVGRSCHDGSNARHASATGHAGAHDVGAVSSEGWSARQTSGALRL